ncbi:hypothetical protein J6590_002521 [Homalodisca vitripennis]|nr:hypothetical protein J6590_002521 [Homalodisca vitripennis]
MGPPLVTETSHGSRTETHDFSLPANERQAINQRKLEVLRVSRNVRYVKLHLKRLGASKGTRYMGSPLVTETSHESSKRLTISLSANERQAINQRKLAVLRISRNIRCIELHHEMSGYIGGYKWDSSILLLYPFIYHPLVLYLQPTTASVDPYSPRTHMKCSEEVLTPSHYNSSDSPARR